MKPALIIGAAECVHDDLDSVRAMVDWKLSDRFRIVGVNDGGVLWEGPLHDWVSIHGDEFPEREARREELGAPGGYRKWTVEDVHPDYRVDGGTSALLAAGAMRSEGHDRIVLAGCPFGPMGYAVKHMHHENGEWPFWRTYQEALPSLMRQHSWIEECVRSMSGFTRDLLGEPYRKWLRLEDGLG